MESPPPGPLRIAFETAAVAVLYALLNRFSERFQITPGGVSILFLPTAVSVVAGFRLGFLALPAIVAGTFLTPWAGGETAPATTLAYGLVNSLEALGPALALRFLKPFDLRLGDPRSIGIYVLSGLVLNTGANAAAGNAVHTLANPGAGLDGSRIVLWWVADLAAALILATPFLLLTTDRNGAEARHVDRRDLIRIGAGLAFATLVVGTSQLLGIGLFHWFAILFLLPILLAAVQHGFRAGVLVASSAAILFLGEMLLLLRYSSPGWQSLSTSESLVTVYLNTLVFFSAAGITGLLADQRHRLLDDLDRKNRQLRDDFFRTVATFSAATEARDHATVGHVYRTARTAVAIGRKIGLSDADLEILNYGAILHDVGKFGIPDRILQKVGRLEPAERGLVRRHGVIGAGILQNIDVLRPVVPIVLHHQDRWDGDVEDLPYDVQHSPARGETIPLGARILRVADAYDALTSDRPQRRAHSRDVAIEMLRKDRGLEFDPQVVDALLEVLAEKGDIGRGRVPVRAAEM